MRFCRKGMLLRRVTQENARPTCWAGFPRRQWGTPWGPPTHCSCAAGAEPDRSQGPTGPLSPAPAWALPQLPPVTSDFPILGLVENFGIERFLPLGEGLSLNEKHFAENI